MKHPTFIINEVAKRRSQLIADVSGLLLIVVVTWGAIAVLFRLSRDFSATDLNGQFLIILLIVLVLALWGVWIVTILWGAYIRRRDSKEIVGLISISSTILDVGGLQVDRDQISSIKKSRRFLVIEYRLNEKKRRVSVPLSWLPENSAEQLIQEWSNP
jgi:hypothetical protein